MGRWVRGQRQQHHRGGATLGFCHHVACEKSTCIGCTATFWQPWKVVVWHVVQTQRFHFIATQNYTKNHATCHMHIPIEVQVHVRGDPEGKKEIQQSSLCNAFHCIQCIFNSQVNKPKNNIRLCGLLSKTLYFSWVMKNKKNSSRNIGAASRSEERCKLPIFFQQPISSQQQKQSKTYETARAFNNRSRVTTHCFQRSCLLQFFSVLVFHH